MSLSKQETPRIKIAVCGEVNSGKTSLLQAVCRLGPLPDFSGAEQKPTIRVAFGAETEVVTYTTDEGTTEITTFDELPSDVHVKDVCISSAEQGPGNCEFIEFPALRDGHLKQEIIDQIAQCDIHVWMTIGSQAWRLSEKTIIDKIPGRLRERSVLVVSRADKFRKTADQERLTARLSAETSSYFVKGGMLKADPPTLLLVDDDYEAWDQVGGKEIFEVLSDLVEVVEEERKRAPAAAAADDTVDVLGAIELNDRSRSKRTRRPKNYWRGHNDRFIPNLDLNAPPDEFEEQRPVVQAAPVAPSAAEPVAETVAEAAPVAPLTAEPVAETETEVAPVAPSAAEAAVETETEAASPIEKVEVSEQHKAAPKSEPSTDLRQQIADTLDGLVALATFSVSAPDSLTLISGDKDKALEFATNLTDAVEMIFTQPVYENPEWVHMALSGHQVLYGRIDDDDTVLLLVCRSANAGMARNAYLRMFKSEREAVAA